MKVICLDGQNDHLTFEDAPQSRPGMGEVLIRVHVVSVMWQEPPWSET
ncbi:hypothetical protein [Dictyobacter formicarum]|uniref:Alcohol dehydrogenase N-terminal domain-containing protein n=1 Tax=Dictyobacter formicarum TaxID=2778368 RepID=A0ABQ3VN69_9CHLR|nr:hypothetical protein [Dictyobacter formicarum]GHO87126.1 hypothetical protein KSZ_51320 [Dictyobacter formicarum]